VTLFAFDLDGTLTRHELLPRIAAAVSLEREMAELTLLTLRGVLPFEDSFRRRFAMLRHLPLHVAREIAEETPLDASILRFIQERPEQCIIVTGNLDLWIMPLLARVGCRYFASMGKVGHDGPHLISVLNKGEALRELRAEYARKGKTVRIIAVGEGVNDIPMLREADVAVAFAGVHDPVPAVLEHAQHVADDGASLCALLERI
jgi:HAD superfamily phosphoserine phosphatase-like hydrolase